MVCSVRPDARTVLYILYDARDGARLDDEMEEIELDDALTAHGDAFISIRCRYKGKQQLVVH